MTVDKKFMNALLSALQQETAAEIELQLLEVISRHLKGSGVLSQADYDMVSRTQTMMNKLIKRVDIVASQVQVGSNPEIFQSIIDKRPENNCKLVTA
jgi:hypothetical protein